MPFVVPSKRHGRGTTADLSGGTRRDAAGRGGTRRDANKDLRPRTRDPATSRHSRHVMPACQRRAGNSFYCLTANIYNIEQLEPAARLTDKKPLCRRFSYVEII